MLCCFNRICDYYRVKIANNSEKLLKQMLSTHIQYFDRKSPQQFVAVIVASLALYARFQAMRHRAVWWDIHGSAMVFIIIDAM